MRLHRLAPAAMSVAGAVALGVGAASAASILPGSSPLDVGAAVHSLTRPVTSLLPTAPPEAGSPAAPAPDVPSSSAPPAAPAADPAP
ncbi:MAG: hypothetical protein JWM18_3656, partial [Chloroflexi bacterium]|nr:hypothetical protein [Chloroflexota bacterium]